MQQHLLIKHSNRGLGLRVFGLGPKFTPVKGIQRLQELLSSNTSWAKQRCKKDIKKMISKSAVVVSAWEDNKMIGFGRTTTDEIYRAILWDIVVDKNYQGLGIGGEIIKLIINDKNLIKVEKIYVMTTHCEDFYLKMGFKKEKIQKLMMIQR